MKEADDLLRPALDAAVRVAREGRSAVPPLEVPRSLLRIVGFRRLSAAAYAAVRRALDDDDSFRERVAAAVDPEEVGPAGHLFLTRPEGWEHDLAALARETAPGPAPALDRPGAERTPTGRAPREAGLPPAGAPGAEMPPPGEQTAVLDGRLAAMQHRAEEAEASLQALRGAFDTMTAERDAAREAQARSVDALARLRDERDKAAAERNAAHRRASFAARDRDELAREVERLRTALAERDGARQDSREPAVDAPAVDAPAVEEPAVPPADPSASAGHRPVDLAALSTTVSGAAREAAQLSRALADVAALLGGAADLGGAGVNGGEAPPEAEPGPAPGAARKPRGQRRVPGRLPVPLPSGVFEDGPEAAAFLSRVPGVVFVVDGYNASVGAWPESPLAEQRRRLVAALAELSARHGTTVHVVFDGAEAGLRSLGRGRHGVRVTFTAAGEEADDVILALVEATPDTIPVVVASDDRRVRLGAAARGANVVNQAQLFGLLNRVR